MNSGFLSSVENEAAHFGWGHEIQKLLNNFPGFCGSEVRMHQWKIGRLIVFQVLQDLVLILLEDVLDPLWKFL